MLQTKKRFGPQKEASPQPESFLQLVELFKEEKEMILASHLRRDMRLVRFVKGRVELHPTTALSADVAARLSRHMSDWTGERWTFHFDMNEEGEPTLYEQELAEKQKQMDYARAHPQVMAVMEHFPESELVDFIADEQTNG